VLLPEQIFCEEGVAVAAGVGLIVTDTGPNVADAQPPLAAMVLVIEYVPGVLAARLICPVLVLTNTSPAGEEVNSPPLAPGPNVGVGLAALEQYGPA
jgi:hypothetical protein